MKTIFYGKKVTNSLISDSEFVNDVNTLFYTGANTPTRGMFVAGGPTGYFKLMIFSGKCPEISELNDISQYEFQKLLSFDIPKYSPVAGISGFNLSVIENGIRATLGICNSPTVCHRSGIATWFWYGNTVHPGVHIIGTIGGVGSRNDLEVPSVILTQDEEYKCYGFDFFISSKVSIIGTL